MDSKLRGALSGCLSGEYCRKDINYLIEHCYRIAFAYLEMKVRSRNSFFLKDEKIEDLAWDFIADLFRKDEQGRLAEFSGYFNGKNIPGLTHAEVHIQLRRLVFSKVEDNIFRFYGEKDPSLKKIIRNLKLGITSHPDYGEKVQYCSGNLIIMSESANQKPSMPREFMQIKLCTRLTEKMQIPEILDEVVQIISHQEIYSMTFPVVSLAGIIRENFVLLNQDEQPDLVKPKADNQLLKQELDHFLEHSVLKVKNSVGSRYVKNGKLEEGLVNIYFHAASDIVKSDFSSSREEASQFEQLKAHREDLDYKQYRQKHRPVFEYIVKLVRQDLLNRFKKEWVRL